MPNIPVCRECGSTSLTWDTHNKNISQAQHGRLTTQDVRCQFVLGCNHCSETLAVVSADQVAAWLTETRPGSTDQSAHTGFNEMAEFEKWWHSTKCGERSAFAAASSAWDARAALSASAEPSTPASFIACHVDECCGQSAPVERDERAEFEAFALDKGWLPHQLKQRPDGNYEDWGVNPEWQAWKARAALERTEHHG